MTILILQRALDPGGAVNFYRKPNLLSNDIIRIPHARFLPTWYSWSGTHIAIMIRPFACIAILLFIHDANWAKSCSPLTDFGNVPVKKISSCTLPATISKQNPWYCASKFPTNLLTSLCLSSCQGTLASWARRTSPSRIHPSLTGWLFLPMIQPRPTSHYEIKMLLAGWYLLTLICLVYFGVFSSAITFLKPELTSAAVHTPRPGLERELKRKRRIYLR